MKMNVRNIIPVFFHLAVLFFLAPGILPAQDYNITKPSVPGPMDIYVNAYSGNLYHQRQDLVLPARGMDIDIHFSYNTARRDRNYGFGPGWTFSYNMTYAEDSLGILLERMDGRQDLYREENGSLVSAKGVFDRMEEFEPGQYRLRSRSGTYYYFEDPSHKRLTKIVDRNGNTQTLVYADSMIQTIIGPAGRMVDFIWTGGRLTQITTQTTPERTIQIEYDDNGNPVSVINPAGGMINYQYDEQYKITAIIDENGNPVNITYNSLFAVEKVISCFNTQHFIYDYANLKSHVVERVGGAPQVTTYAYNELGQLAKQEGNCCGATQTFEYDDNDNIIKRTDANGNATLYSYDALGNVTQEIDAMGQAATFVYEPAFNNLVSRTDRNGNAWGYVYDERGNLLRMNKPLNIANIFTYNEFGQRESVTDGNGNRMQFEYTLYGQLARITDARGSETSFTYDTFGNVLTTTDPNGNLTQFSFDELNRLIGLTDALGNSESYTYDNRGNRLTFTDRKGSTTRYVYDALDRLTELEDALGNKTAYAYDERGNLIQATDANGNRNRFGYDKQNRLVSAKNAIGDQILYEYDAKGNLIGLILANGNTVNLDYDALDRVNRISDNLGVISEYQYDKTGNRISYIDGEGNTTTLIYDALNRLLRLTDPLGESISYQYDANDNLISVTDRNGHTTAYTFDEINRRTSVTDALNFTSTYDYDPSDNLLTLTDQKGNVTSYVYDALHRLTSETYADGSTRAFTYDVNNQMVSRTDNNGQTTTYEYDVIYRMTSRIYPDGARDDFAYDAVGNLLRASNANATLAFTYDDINRMTSETLNGKTTGFAYNTQQRKRTIFYPGGRQIEEVFDVRNRLESIMDATILMDQLAAYEYTPTGHISRRTFINNTFTELDYDANRRLVSLSHNLPNGQARYQYAHDKVGNRLNESRPDQPNASRQFIYDNLHRLVQEKTGAIVGEMIPNPLAQTEWQLDGLGNRITEQKDGAATTYAANELNQYTRLSGADNYSPAYDANGNMLSDGAFDFSYDTENRLVQVDNGQTATYLYGPLGRRLAKVIGNDTTYYYYDKLRVVEERGNGEAIKATYAFGAGLDEVIYMQRDDRHFFYHQDALGSTTHMTDLEGNIVERYQYDAFGNPEIFNAAGSPIARSAVDNPYLFTGRRYDAETGLYYYRFRYYSPKLGRFIHRDPLKYSDGLNMYQYVYGNPVNWVDPMGLTSSPCFWDNFQDLIDQFANALGWSSLGLFGLSAALAATGVGLPFAAALASVAGFAGLSSTGLDIASAVISASQGNVGDAIGKLALNLLPEAAGAAIKNAPKIIKALDPLLENIPTPKFTPNKPPSNPFADVQYPPKNPPNSTTSTKSPKTSSNSDSIIDHSDDLTPGDPHYDPRGPGHDLDINPRDPGRPLGPNQPNIPGFDPPPGLNGGN